MRIPDLLLFRRAPARGAFVMIAIVSVALAIGATIAVFSILDAVLLRPMPFGARSARLVSMYADGTRRGLSGDARTKISTQELLEIQRQSTAFEALGTLFGRDFTVMSGDGAERLMGYSVTPELFALLGVSPFIGRSFVASEAQGAPGQESVVILTYALWQRQFGGDRSIVGRDITVNDRARTVIGVMPEGFRFPDRAEAYMPLALTPPRGARAFSVVGLLRDGVTLPQAQHELAAISRALESTFPLTSPGFDLRLEPYRDSQVGRVEQVLSSAVMGAVTFVLLIGCLNLGNLLLLQTVARQQEFAIRATLGASRWRLATGILSESLLIAVGGTAAGMLVAVWLLRLANTAWSDQLPYWVRFAFDVRVVLFSITVMVLTALAVGLLPAVIASRVDAWSRLRDGDRSASMSRRARRTQAGLVTMQVSLCLALLVGAVLVVRSFLAVQGTSLGFDDGRLLTLRLYLPGDGFDEVPTRAAFIDSVVGALSSVHGASAAAATSALPGVDEGEAISLGNPASRGLEALSVRLIRATPSLFDTLGLRAVDGRPFTGDESRNPRAGVAVVSASLARLLWPEGSPIERRLDLFGGLRVVGVVPDIVYGNVAGPRTSAPLTVYLPYAAGAPRTLAFVVRASGNGTPALLGRMVRERLRQLNGGVPFYTIRTMTENRDASTFTQRFASMLMTGFAGTALLLACIGVYALAADGVRQRRVEIGTRIALGARPAQLVWQFVREGALVSGLGLLLGAVLALVVARLVRHVITGFGDTFVVIVAASSVLVVVVAVAFYLPARRATRVAPSDLLRTT